MFAAFKEADFSQVILNIQCDYGVTIKCCNFLLVLAKMFVLISKCRHGWSLQFVRNCSWVGHSDCVIICLVTKHWLTLRKQQRVTQNKYHMTLLHWTHIPTLDLGCLFTLTHIKSFLSSVFLVLQQCFTLVLSLLYLQHIYIISIYI